MNISKIKILLRNTDFFFKILVVYKNRLVTQLCTQLSKLPRWVVMKKARSEENGESKSGYHRAVY